ncbi:hypothetical protein GCM10012275_54650 [Longimycelium tulufanense]|uniref:Uncharacterized protein n=1 Tax=Longimycelium tulufanense TaxID=907463 RepID=A0A8J3CD90_9PSEU|nr:hypothetical protein [Longimycelium tulufanense]GGM77092.1 hypothetical protein GCM10012275_54650 [Longimycelium tulufanense]
MTDTLTQADYLRFIITSAQKEYDAAKTAFADKMATSPQEAIEWYGHKVVHAETMLTLLKQIDTAGAEAAARNALNLMAKTLAHTCAYDRALTQTRADAAREFLRTYREFLEDISAKELLNAL